MDQKRALVKLLESADLIRMLEDLTNTNGGSQLSSSTLGGIRITLRNVRDAVLASHDALCADGLGRQVLGRNEPMETTPHRRPIHQEILREEMLAEPEPVEFMTKTNTGFTSHHGTSVKRGDIRSSLGKN